MFAGRLFVQRRLRRVGWSHGPSECSETGEHVAEPVRKPESEPKPKPDGSADAHADAPAEPQPGADR